MKRLIPILLFIVGVLFLLATKPSQKVESSGLGTSCTLNPAGPYDSTHTFPRIFNRIEQHTGAYYEPSDLDYISKFTLISLPIDTQVRGFRIDPVTGKPDLQANCTNCTNIAAYIRTKNPNIKIIGYVLGTSVWGGAPSVSHALLSQQIWDRVNNPDGILNHSQLAWRRYPSLIPLPYDSASDYWVNLADTEIHLYSSQRFNQWFGDFMRTEVWESGYWDGLIFDDLNTNWYASGSAAKSGTSYSGLGGVVDLDKNGTNDVIERGGFAAISAAMRTGVTEYLAEVVPSVIAGGGVVLGNGAWETQWLDMRSDFTYQTPPNATYSPHESTMSGFLDEGWLGYPVYNESSSSIVGGPTDSYRWDLHMRVLYHWFNNSGYKPIAILQTAPANWQDFRLKFTSALLTDGYFTTGGWSDWFAVDSNGNGLPIISAASVVTPNLGYLGCPTGEAYAYLSEDGSQTITLSQAMKQTSTVTGSDYLLSNLAWRRDYTYGTVLVNPTGRTVSFRNMGYGIYRVILSASPQYPYDIGTVYNTVSLQSQDGVILLKTADFGPPATPTPTVVPTRTPTPTVTPTPTITPVPTWDNGD